ncbi:MAG: SulP family inorganic anion transporter [Cyclobacteriaceae bacterium]
MQGRRFLADLTAGLTVSFAAISLGAAFGAMSGRGAFAGMIGAAVIPIITSIFGGTRLQASGPTAPMTAVTALIIAYAYDHFPDRVLAEQFITLVFILNAVCLIIAGLVQLGKLISFVPNVVILGFMNGIAVLIWKDQVAKVFALAGKPIMEGGIALNLFLAVVTFGLIFGIIRLLKVFAVRPVIRSLISGVLWSIIIITIVSAALGLQVEKVQLGATIGSFGEFASLVAAYFPSAAIFQIEYLKMAIPFALQLTLLAYLDSLLTALVIDRMTGEKSQLNRELVAQGLANGVSGLLQGLPGAQATIRSVLLIKEGAQTRLAGVLIGVFALLSIVLFKDYLALVPAAVFVGVLVKVGLDVCDKDFPRFYLRYNWALSLERNIQLIFILYTTAATVLINLNVAVVSGTIIFYVCKHFWSIQDVEGDFEEVSERESKYITG